MYLFRRRGEDIAHISKYANTPVVSVCLVKVDTRTLVRNFSGDGDTLLQNICMNCIGALRNEFRNETRVPQSIDDALYATLPIFPDATFDEDNENQLILYTGLKNDGSGRYIPFEAS